MNRRAQDGNSTSDDYVASYEEHMAQATIKIFDLGFGMQRSVSRFSTTRVIMERAPTWKDDVLRRVPQNLWKSGRRRLFAVGASSNVAILMFSFAAVTNVGRAGV